jgi:glutamyl-tRNA reductase
MVEKAMHSRKEQKQIYIDLSVPRNINENISKINNVHLYGIDDMLSIVDETITNRKEAIEHAKEIIQNMIGELHDWLNSQSLNPLIKQVKNFHSLHKSDLNTFIKSLPESSINTDVLNNFALFLNKKYANRVINNIKEITENGKQIEYINVINKIFETKSHD